MAYQIEKSVPLPARKRNYRSNYPYKDLEIGDSFVVPLEKDKSPSAIYASMSSAKRRFDINLTSARVEGGLRIWRIAAAPQVPNDRGGAGA